MNLARFGLRKDENNVIAPEGYSELVEVSEEEAQESSASIFAWESLGELLRISRSLGTRLAPDLKDKFYSDVDHRSQGSPVSSHSPIPPQRKRKYVKHEKRTSKEFVEKTKKKLGLVDPPEDLLEMGPDKVLEYFSKDGQGEKLDKNLFARNVVWYYYKLVQAGKPPEFVLDGCNMRTIFYVLKTVLTANKIFTSNSEKTKREKERDDNDVDSFYGNFAQAVQTMVLEGLIAYKDFNIIDDRKVFRFLPPARFNTHILLLAEKKSCLGRFMTLASKYGTMAQITSGRSTIVMTDTMLTEMFELGYDFSRPLSILSFCDFDPVGSSIPYHFEKHLNQLGFHNVNYFEQYGDKTMYRQTGTRNGRPIYKTIHQRRPCLDIVNPHDLDTETRNSMRHVLKASIRDNPSTADWAFITGGVTGTGRNTRYAISAEHFLPYVSEHLDQKLKHRSRTDCSRCTGQTP